MAHKDIYKAARAPKRPLFFCIDLVRDISYKDEQCHYQPLSLELIAASIVKELLIDELYTTHRPVLPMEFKSLSAEEQIELYIAFNTKVCSVLHMPVWKILRRFKNFFPGSSKVASYEQSNLVPIGGIKPTYEVIL